jgi:hypothetical protein
LLKYAEERSLKHLQVFGDSKLMIDWTNQGCSIGNMGLISIMKQVKEVKATFESISFTHVYFEFNTQANILSKEALIMQEGTLLVHEYRGGTLISKSQKSLY